MCGPIKEEVSAVGNVVGVEGGNSDNLNDEVFVDAVEGGGIEGVEGVEDNVGVLNVGGAGAGVSIDVKNNGEEGVGGAVMETNEVGEMDNDYITMEEVVGDAGDDDKDKEGGNGEGGEKSKVEEIVNIGENVGAEGGTEGNIGANVSGGDGLCGDGSEIGEYGSPVTPIPLIPRWRLREILAHAEGTCDFGVVRV